MDNLTTEILIFWDEMISCCFVGADFGGVLWLELIGGMPSVVHKVLLRMALVRSLIDC